MRKTSYYSSGKESSGALLLDKWYYNNINWRSNYAPVSPMPDIYNIEMTHGNRTYAFNVVNGNYKVPYYVTETGPLYFGDHLNPPFPSGYAVGEYVLDAPGDYVSVSDRTSEGLYNMIFPDGSQVKLRDKRLYLKIVEVNDITNIQNIFNIPFFDNVIPTLPDDISFVSGRNVSGVKQTRQPRRWVNTSPDDTGTPSFNPDFSGNVGNIGRFTYRASQSAPPRPEIFNRLQCFQFSDIGHVEYPGQYLEPTGTLSPTLGVRLSDGLCNLDGLSFDGFVNVRPGKHIENFPHGVTIYENNGTYFLCYWLYIISLSEVPND